MFAEDLRTNVKTEDLYTSIFEKPQGIKVTTKEYTPREIKKILSEERLKVFQELNIFCNTFKFSKKKTTNHLMANIRKEESKIRNINWRNRTKKYKEILENSVVVKPAYNEAYTKLEDKE